MASEITKGFKAGIKKRKIGISRMKVFSQILMIIGIMLLVIVVQGFMSYKMLGKLQNNTNEVFRKSAGKIGDVGRVKYELEEIRAHYLQVMLGKDLPYSSESPIRDSTLTMITLKEIDPVAVEQMGKEFQILGRLVTRPSTEAGYEELNKSISGINMNLNIIADKINANSLETVEESKTDTFVSQTTTGVIAIIGLVFSLLIGLGLASSISSPLKSMAAAADSLAKGDLTKEVKVGGSYEVSNTMESLNSAILGLKNLVTRIDEQADILVTASDELKCASSDTGQSAVQVARAMEEIAKASSEQSNQINKAVETIHLSAELVRKVSVDTETLAISSEKIAESAKMGQKATDAVTSQINELFLSTQEVEEVINELSQNSEEISDITGVIEGIAEQTTLLALNASIEAARAGEQGKGFSVVAKETGKLADQSKEAAQLIVELIGRMRQRTVVAVTAIQKGLDRVDKGKSLAKDATTTFGNIFKTLIDNLAQIERVAHSARQMASSNENVIGAISTIAAIAEESLASTEEVSATAEEQSASVEQVTALTENLLGVANHLKKSISEFEV